MHSPAKRQLLHDAYSQEPASSISKPKQVRPHALPDLTWQTCAGFQLLVKPPERWSVGLFSPEKRGLGGILSIDISTQREGANRMEPGSFQWCPVTGPEAMGPNWNTGGSLWTPGKTLSPGGWPSTGSHRMVGVGRDLCRSSSPKQVHSEQVVTQGAQAAQGGCGVSVLGDIQ